MASLGLAACGEASKPAPATVPQVSVQTVRHGGVPLSVELPGRTAAFLVAEVRARVDGVVLKRSFDEGADVRAGQPLYQIDPAPFRAALANAEASLQRAQANLVANNAQLERYKILITGNAVSKQAYDNALAAQLQSAADVAAARASVTTAGINLAYTSVTAPIAGRSSVSQVTQGGYVQGGAATLLTTVQQIDPMYVDLQQSSAEGLALRRQLAEGSLKSGGPEQASVTLKLEDGSTYAQAGTLEFSGVTVNQATGSVTLRARFPNPQHLLLPGMFVRASVNQGVRQNALLVPVQAITRNPLGEATVMLAGTDGKTELRKVNAGTLLHGNWVIDAGLKDGERVIVSGVQKIKPGTTVKAVEADAAPSAQAASQPAAQSALAQRS
ncbi:efflux RND transporter periplasmic adaptor subunit [Janthinobacterium agaricidamnosum]|uniref:Acriflavine resistance protein A n=1 Tax=Janthinobacterium agaricidamnosum NBRC 102515 = DSM 9628 TaxID=1349767 RepID=W0V9D9_9BURK|nr:efflux RND transporter periplasmic adaptor subunit [Janthinobacterium agaricidamnosum]CDG83943.1 acriflavine resistance protein A [Janthinobacterium agaricidamnosum NBRC 102515 = DSM 9628]